MRAATEQPPSKVTPVDTDALRAAKVNGSALFTGTMRTFLDVGFSEIARTYPSRPVMRLEL